MLALLSFLFLQLGSLIFKVNLPVAAIAIRFVGRSTATAQGNITITLFFTAISMLDDARAFHQQGPFD